MRLAYTFHLPVDEARVSTQREREREREWDIERERGGDREREREREREGEREHFIEINRKRDDTCTNKNCNEGLCGLIQEDLR